MKILSGRGSARSTEASKNNARIALFARIARIAPFGIPGVRSSFYPRHCMNDENTIQNTTDAGAEGLRRENEELRNAARLRDARDQITAELARAGARSPALIFESVKGRIEFGEDGKALNAPALLAEIRQAYPEQFAAGEVPPPIDAGTGASATPRVLTAEGLSKMTAAEIAKLDWAEVKPVLSGS